MIRHPSCGSGAVSADFCRVQPAPVPRGSAPRSDAMSRSPPSLAQGICRKPVGCAGLNEPNAGLGGIGVGFFGAWRSYEGSVETYRGMARIGIRGAWGSARHGLQCVICEMRDCRLCGFFVNYRGASDVYEWPPVQAYRNPAPVSAGMRPIWRN